MKAAEGERPSGGDTLLRRIRKADRPRRRDNLVRQIKEALSSAAAGGADRIPYRIRARLLAYVDTTAFDRAGAADGLAANVAEATFQLNEIFSYGLRFDVARALLKIYCARWPDARPLNTMVPFLVGLDGPCDGFRDDQENDLQVVHKPGARTTFVVFTGIRHAFGVQLNVLHHACVAPLAANVVYTRDFSLCHYLTGIRSLETIEQTCRELSGIFRRLGTERLVMLGNSGGVFGALYYATLLDADQVLAFSGPSSLDIGAEHSERQIYAQLSDLRSQGKIAWPDIRSLYAARRTPISMYFGENNKFDRAQAEHLQELPNVSLHPFPTGHHFIVDDLVAIGTFQAALEGALAPAS